MMNTNATNFRKDMFNMLEQAVVYNEHINIATKDGNAIVISEQDYRDLMETVHLLSIPNMKEKIIDGLNTDVADCVPESDVDL